MYMHVHVGLRAELMITIEKVFGNFRKLIDEKYVCV